MATLDLDGTLLSYVDSGDSGGGAPTLAFAHGWCSKLQHWDAQAAYFAPAWRVLRWDRRGMAGSPCAVAATSSQRHAEDLLALADHLGIERLVVAGHAGGGPTALRFAAEHPERTAALVMVDTTLNDPADPAGAVFRGGVERSMAKLAELSEPDAAAYLAKVYRRFFGPRADPAVVDDAVANAAATPAAVAAGDIAAMVEDTVGYAGRVRAPVLWVSANPGDADAVGAAFAATTVMVGHVVGSGHFVQVEVPDQLNAMMAAFFAATLVVTLDAPR